MVTKVKIEREIVADGDFDSSYLEQDGWEERLEQFNHGEFSFVGVRAVAHIEVSAGDDWSTTFAATIKSPGLWSIESDSGEDYFNEVFEEEKKILLDMLANLNSIEIE